MATENQALEMCVLKRKRCARGLRFVDLNLTLRVFLRVLWFSSLCKFDFHAKIWAVERLNISLLKNRKNGQPLPSQLTLNKVVIYLFIYLFIYLVS